jgi:hypothetical protein
MSITDHVVAQGNILYTFTNTVFEKFEDPSNPKKCTGYGQEETLLAIIPADKRTEVAHTITPWLITEKGLDEDYAKWKAGLGDAGVSGTPLETWVPIQANPAAKANLAARGIRTVEQFAAIDEGVLASFGQGLRSLRDAAIKATQIDNSAEVTAVKDQLAQVMAELAALKAGGSPKPDAAPLTDSDAQQKELLVEMINAAGGKGDKRKSIATLQAELDAMNAAKAA